MLNIAELKWLNAPAKSEVRGGDLFVRTDSKTDFWRETFYGFRRDSGHFAYQSVEGDFTAEVTIDGRYEALYGCLSARNGHVVKRATGGQAGANRIDPEHRVGKNGNVVSPTHRQPRGTLRDGRQSARRAVGGAGKRTRRKRMAGCNGLHRGPNFALTRKGADFREVWLSQASI